MSKGLFYRLLVVLCLSALLISLAACGEPTATPAADPTATPAPTTEPPTATATAKPTATATAKPTATATAKPTATARPTSAASAAGGGSSAASAAPTVALAPDGSPLPVTTGKYGKEVEAIRKDTIKKLDDMNDILTDLRSQIINSQWDKAKDDWKKAHLLFFEALTLTPQVFVNDLFGNMQAQLDERPIYGFQVLEQILWDPKKPPTKETALPVAARLGRDGKQGRNLMLKTDLDALMVFRGMRNICGGMAEFLGESGPNSLSQTAAAGTRAKLKALKDSYSVFQPYVEQLGPDTNKKVLDNIKKVEQLIAGESADPHTVDLAAKELIKALDEAGDVLRVDPLLEGPALLQELGNLRVALDGAIDGIYRDNMDIVGEQYSDFEVAWDGKVGRSLKEVDVEDYQAINDLRQKVNEALYYGVTPDKEQAKQLLVDQAKAVDKSIANVRKIPFTPQTTSGS